MKPISYNQEMGDADTERLLCPGDPEGPALFQSYQRGKRRLQGRCDRLG